MVVALTDAVDLPLDRGRESSCGTDCPDDLFVVFGDISEARAAQSGVALRVDAFQYVAHRCGRQDRGRDGVADFQYLFQCVHRIDVRRI